MNYSSFNAIETLRSRVVCKNDCFGILFGNYCCGRQEVDVKVQFTVKF